MSKPTPNHWQTRTTGGQYSESPNQGCNETWRYTVSNQGRYPTPSIEDILEYFYIIFIIQHPSVNRGPSTEVPVCPQSPDFVRVWQRQIVHTLCKFSYTTVGRFICLTELYNFSNSMSTQQNSYFVSHLLGTVATLWLGSDSSVCWQVPAELWLSCQWQWGHLLAVVNSHYTFTVQSQFSDCA